MGEEIENIRCFDCGDKLEVVEINKYPYMICVDYICRRVHNKDGIAFIEKGKAFYYINRKLIEKDDSMTRCILCGGLTENTNICLYLQAKINAIKCIKCGRLFDKKNECLLPLFIIEKPAENDYERDVTKDRPAYYDDYLKAERGGRRVYLVTYEDLQENC